MNSTNPARWTTSTGRNHFEAPPPLPEAVVCVTKEHMDAMEAENARLRKLVEDAYREGLEVSIEPTTGMALNFWNCSDAKKRLENE